MSRRTDANRFQSNEATLAQQASQWLETLKRDEPSQREAFAAWLKESPRNVREYLLMVSLDKELSGIDADRRHDVARLLAQAPVNVVTLDCAGTRPDPLRSRSLRGRWQWSIALAAGVVAAISIWRISDQQGQRYSTQTGEQRVVELEDGSVMQLNTQSRLEVRLSEAGRDIELIEGEATFKVARAANRPFRVHTDAAVIQALGTQFNVYRSAAGTTVSVLDGSVKVSGVSTAGSAILGAGEEARVRAAGPVVKVAKPDVSNAVSWQQRRLVFAATALTDIAAEFNRYNRRPQLRLEGNVGVRHYTGTFDADDPEALALLLSQERDLAVENDSNEIVIRPRE